MSGRGMALLGPVIAGGCGVAIMYSTLQPELVKEQAAREHSDPAFVRQHPKEHLQHDEQAAEAQRDTAISRAMAEDFKEAGKQVKQDGGFAWGIRKALFGSSQDNDNEKK